MAEAHLRIELDQSRRLGRPRRIRSDPELLGRAPQQRRVAGRFGGGGHEQALRVGRERQHLAAEVLFDAAREWCASGRPNPPASSAAVNPRGNSSNASGFPRVSATIRSRTRSSSRPGTTESSSAWASASTQTRYHELRQTDERLFVGRLAHGEDHRNRVREEPARDERECLRGRAVEPLRIVDHAEERLLLGHFGQQSEHGETDDETIHGFTGNEAERGVQRVALWIG